MSTLELLFSFKGRIGRRLFWLGTFIPICITSIPLYFLTGTQTYIYIIHIISYILIAWILTATYTKRLHDINQSGSVLLIFYIPALITYTLSILKYNQKWVITSGYITFLIGLWITIIVASKQGMNGQKKLPKYGHLFSFSYFNWISKFKFLNKPGKINQHGKQSVHKAGQTSVEEEILTSEMPNKKSDLLTTWLNKIDPDLPSSNINSDDEQIKLSKNSDENLNTVEPEILRATQSIFVNTNKKQTSKIQDKTIKVNNPTVPENNAVSTIDSNSINELERTVTSTRVKHKGFGREKNTVKNDSENFFRDLKNRATTSPSHQLYLQNSAEAGNSWAKLEIAATWLTNSNIDQDHAKRAINYLSELANSSQSHLGAETEASYFLGEIYRIGFRYTHPNEDLSFKYLIRAASLGHKKAQQDLATQLLHTATLENKTSLSLSVINNALLDRESSNALLQLIEFDWSITYIDSVNLVLRTLVDQGNGQAARFLGRMFLERSDYEAGARTLYLADKLDETTIDKIIDIVKGAQSSENIINSLVGLIKKHARLDNSYANYQMALAFSEGIGMPQDQMMAFVHVTVASAKVYGHDRDKLIKLRNELRELLSEEEITAAQKIIRETYSN